MAHLWYSTLGNKAYCPPFNASCSGAGFPQPGWGLTNTGNFQNMAALYWSGLEYSLGKSWAFNSGDGVQYFQPKTDNWWAMAVLDGDVLVSAVPEPETYALMLAGLAVVGATAKRKASRAQ
jgi:hypothetical protein